MKYLLWFCAILAAVMPLLAQTSNIGALAGRQIAVQSKDSAAQGKGEANLGTETVWIQSSSELKQVLERRGIEPDADALSVVYSMNPGLKKDSSQWQVVHIPMVNGFDPANTGRVNLDVDRQLKDSITESHTRVVERIGIAPESVRYRLSPASVALGDVSLAVKVHPASQAFLHQVERESLILKTISSKEALTVSDEATVQMITKDLEVKNEGLKADAPDPTLTVRTVGSVDGKEISLLTVCYVPAALYGGKCDAEFKRPTSPTHQDIPIANYLMWAQDSTDGSQKTTPKPVEVRSDDDVTLVIKQ